MHQPNKVKCVLFSIVICNIVDWLHAAKPFIGVKSPNKIPTEINPWNLYGFSIFRVHWKVVSYHLIFDKSFQVAFFFQDLFHDEVDLSSIKWLKKIFGVALKFFQAIKIT